jgi:hypothetical protein
VQDRIRATWNRSQRTVGVIQKKPSAGGTAFLKDGACLDLSLSDQRSYLHGGDLLDTLMTTFSIQTPVTLRIFKLTNAVLQLSRSERHPTDRRAAFLSLGDTGATQGYWLSRHPQKVITQRSTLLDDHILSQSDITPSAASITNPDPARLGRVALVLAVALLTKLYPGSKWLLGDISSQCYFLPVACFSVKLHHDSFRFVSLFVDADGTDWGHLVLVKSQDGTSRHAQ